MLTKDQILQLLLALNEELARRNQQGSLLVCGGALMALSYNKERVTEDIDALYHPKDEIEEIVRKFAEKRNLPQDWLNDAVTGYLKLAEIEPVPVLAFSNLEVRGIPESALLAMKLMAGRQKDEQDIIHLLVRKGNFNAEDLIQQAQAYFPKDLFIGKKLRLKNLIGQYEPLVLAKQHYQMRHHDENLVNALAEFTVSASWPLCMTAEDICAKEFDTEYERNAQIYIDFLMKEERESTKKP